MLSFPNTTNQGGHFSELYDEDGNRVHQTDERLNMFDTSRIKSFNMNLNSTIKKQLLAFKNTKNLCKRLYLKSTNILNHSTKDLTIYKQKSTIDTLRKHCLSMAKFENKEIITIDYNDLIDKPTIDNALSNQSTNAVQNKIVTNSLNQKYSFIGDMQSFIIEKMRKLWKI